nr:unnamed protein product [Ipomoea batatas]
MGPLGVLLFILSILFNDNNRLPGDRNPQLAGELSENSGSNSFRAGTSTLTPVKSTPFLREPKDDVFNVNDRLIRVLVRPVEGFNRRPAQRASSVRMKPHINTLSVKRVVTFGQKPALLVILELRQAHGAFHRLCPVLGRVLENRQRSNHGRFEPTAGGASLVIINIEHNLRAAVPTAPAEELPAALTEEMPTRVKMQQHN